MLKTILIALTLGFSTIGYSQNDGSTDPEFVVFIVDGISSKEDCRAVDNHMRRLEHIVLSRMDIPTSRYYAVFNAESDYDEQWFSQEFAKLGPYTIHCYFKGTKGIDRFPAITKESCPELN